MKVRIEMTVEVNAEQWANEYGIDVKDVNNDVKSYIIHWAENTPIPLKVIKTNYPTIGKITTSISNP